jgi:hypothetical protein
MTSYRRTLNTSCDSRYFSRAVNLINSVRKYSSEKIKIRVWDIGLHSFQIYFLNSIGIEVVKVPAFVSHWNLCYTWKIYVLNNIPEEIVLHLDAGNTLKTDIADIFKIIESDGFFFVDQGVELSKITPVRYMDFINKDMLQRPVFACGNIGFRRSNNLSDILGEAYHFALRGYCLGYSKKEYPVVGKIKLPLRNCEIFRHDQTLLNVLIYNSNLNFVLLDHEVYSCRHEGHDSLIFNNRNRSYKYVCLQQGYKVFFYLLLIDFFYKAEETMLRLLKRFLSFSGTTSRRISVITNAPAQENRAEGAEN